MKPNRTILLIAPHHSYRAIVYLQAAKRLAVKIFFVTDGVVDLLPQSHLGSKTNLSSANAITRLVLENLIPSDIAAVIAPDEKFGEVAAQVAANLGVLHNPIPAVQVSSNKMLARTTLHKAGLPVPEFHLIDLNQELSKIEEVKYPCVAKPVNLSASRGVIRADSENELIQALHRIKSLLKFENDLSSDQYALVEQYVEGSEHALEGFLSDSKLETICIFDKPDPLEGPFFEETYYVTPSGLDSKLQQRIEKIVLDACLAYGLKYGPIHAEVRVHDDEIWILEVAARSIGGDCARLFELATHCTLEEYILARAVHKRVEKLKFQTAAGVLMIPVSTNGILRRVEGVTQAQSVDNILEVQLDVRTGDKLTKWPEGGKYPGFIYSNAISPEVVENSLRKAHSKLKFVCSPEIPVVVH